MVQRIRSYEEGLRKGLGIVVRCPGCDKKAIFRCSDFMGYISPAADIEKLTWRCTWCRTVSNYVRYTLIDEKVGRESFAQWRPGPRQRRCP